MIISDRNKFVFIHIPKCAGTSVRSRIEHLDDRNGAYSSRLDEHPELGLLNYVHIPLQTLKDQFPSEYVCVETYRSMAVMRDPSSRFVSSVSQYCNRYSDVEMRNHNIKTLRKQVDKLIDAIEEQEVLNPGGRLPAKLIHFQNITFMTMRKNIVSIFYKVFKTKSFFTRICIHFFIYTLETNKLSFINICHLVSLVNMRNKDRHQ